MRAACARLRIIGKVLAGAVTDLFFYDKRFGGYAARRKLFAALTAADHRRQPHLPEARRDISGNPGERLHLARSGTSKSRLGAARFLRVPEKRTMLQDRRSGGYRHAARLR